MGRPRNTLTQPHTLYILQNMKKLLTQAHLKSIIQYDPTTGVFTWAVDRAANALKSTQVYISKDKHTIKTGSNCYRAKHLAWLYVYGEMPRVVYHKDGDLTNFRINNLTTSCPAMPHKDLSLLELANLVKYNHETGMITMRDNTPIKYSTNKRWRYLSTSIQGNFVYIHRLAWACYYGEVPNIIDHIDGCPTNNKINNLRNGDQRQNTQNKRIHRDGRLVGAIKAKNNGWQAVIYLRGVKYHLGYFKTELEAHTVYIDFCKNHELTIC